MPDFVFVAHPGYLVARTHTENGKATVQGPGREFESFSYITTEDDTLPLFYVALNILLGQARLRSVNFLSLWEQLIGQAVERARSGG